jgi:SPP1 family predicted phage head-tail adaptor
MMNNNVSAGRLNRRIQIQANTTSQDAFGGVIQNWSTLYSCWANIDVQGSQLQYSTAEFISNTTYRITIRYTSSVVISPSQRVIYTDPATGIVHTYEIKGVMNDLQENKQLTLLCYSLDNKE